MLDLTCQVKSFTEHRLLQKTLFSFYLDDNVTFPCSSAVKLSVLLHHHNLPFLFYLLHVLLHLVEDAAIILLGYTDKLERIIAHQY